MSDDARAAFARSIDAAVKVNGFRNAGIAPPTHLQEPVATNVQSRDDLAGTVLRVWAESQQPLRDLVADHLRSASLLDGEPDYPANTISLGPLDPRLDVVIDRLIELDTEFIEDELLLMSYYTSGQMPADTEGSEALPTISDESPGVFGQILDILRPLPLESSEWAVIEGMWGATWDAMKTIKEAKLAEDREAAELDAEIRAVARQHARLLEFFEWNVEEELAQRPHPWADIQAARQVISGLAVLLEGYAPVHPIAAVRSEETKRGPRRAELQEQIDGVLAQFEVLEVQAPPTRPQVERPTPDQPDVPGVDTPQPEEEQVVLEAKLATLRAENEWLLTEHQSLESSNRHLTEQVVGELESDLNESRNLAEMWRRSYQDLLKSQESAVGGVLPDFESVAQVVQLAEGRLSDRLSFQLNSKSDLEIPFDHPRQVWDALEWLAATYYQAKTGENGEPDFGGSLRDSCGWRYAPGQADTTVGQYRDYYEAWVGGRKIALLEHIGTGNGYNRGTIRIAFVWGADEKKVIVGYIGRHQRTGAS